MPKLILPTAEARIMQYSRINMSITPKSAAGKRHFFSGGTLCFFAKLDIMGTWFSIEAKDRGKDMAKNRMIAMVITAVLMLTTFISEGMMMKTEAETSRENDFKVVAYYPNWYGDFTSRVQWDKITHVNYAFVLPNKNGMVDSVKGYENVITGLIEAAHENDVKVCVSFGGWSYSDGSLCATVFEAATDSDEKCKLLAESILEIVDEYGFDGVDVDWEYPTAKSKDQYTVFMRYLKEGLTERDKLLTAAVQAVGGSNQPDEVMEMLDWINVMAYDGNEGSGHSPYSYMVNSFAYWNGTRGIPAEKIVLGVPFYERPNWASYADIVKADADNAYTDKAKINGTTVYYNGLETMAKKAQYAAENAGGIMIWEISQDTKDEKLSLLNCIDDTLEAAFAPPVRDAWITVDLGEIKDFDRAVLQWSEGYGETYLLQTSPDGTYWNTTKVVSGQNGGEDTVILSPVKARYVRVSCLKKVSDTEDMLLNVRVF